MAIDVHHFGFDILNTSTWALVMLLFVMRGWQQRFDFKRAERRSNPDRRNVRRPGRRRSEHVR